MKVLRLISVFFLSFLLVQCSDPLLSPVNSQMAVNKGGGHITTAPNNLSFPALLADGMSLSPITESLTVSYAGPYDGLTAEEITALEATGPWYAQKVEGNVWQGAYAEYVDQPVAFIDWGDAMESVNPKIRRPYRVEFGVYVQLAAPMSAYTMALLAFPSSLDETQGTNGTRYDCNYATIATPLGNCVIQKFDDASTLSWNATEGKWDNADDPETGFGFAQELNVGGKYIYGASTGGWKPMVEGTYRITFYFDSGSEIVMTGAQVGDYNEGAPIVPKIGETNTAVVVPENNLTYMDVTVVPGGGSGGGGNGGGGGGHGGGGNH
jgi:hypothetical protein